MCLLHIPQLYTVFVMQHILYHALKDKRLESLVVLNAVRYQVPHKHTGVRWEVLYKFHIRIVFFSFFVLLCQFTFCIKVLCTALGCRVRFSYECHFLFNSQVMLFRSYTRDNARDLTVTMIPIRLVLLFSISQSAFA